MWRKLYIVMLLLLALVSGFAMENLKISVNFMLEYCPSIPHYFEMPPNERAAALANATAYVPFDYYYNHTTPGFLFQFDMNGLEKLKWVITLSFVLLFMFYNAKLISLASNNKKYGRLMYVAYFLFFALSLVIYAAGKFVGDPHMAYAVSRKITHGLQSLVPLMLVYPATWLSEKMKQLEKK